MPTPESNLTMLSSYQPGVDVHGLRRQREALRQKRRLLEADFDRRPDLASAVQLATINTKLTNIQLALVGTCLDEVKTMAAAARA